MSSKNRNVFLIGLMAVGKTTVGRHLAAELGLKFFDADQLIEERAGADVSWIFDVEGEAGFRDREVQVIDDLTRLSGVVVATGGGAVLRPENRRHLAERGTVIFLETPIERLLDRTRYDRKRPLLRGGNARATLERLFRERGPLYESIASYRFCGDRRSAKALAEEIAVRLRADGVFDA
jgi:shikimate kinase